MLKVLLATAAAILCLADAANCIRLGHDDWWQPALLAFIATLQIRGLPG